jgi:hypothetical protein
VALYEFQRNYPQHQDKVNAKLASHGVNFRSYLSRNLARVAAERGETLPDENTKPTTESRSPTKMTAGGTDEAENFKERLAKLQEMFGYRKSASDDASQPGSRLESPVKASEPIVPETASDASVLVLKERLARMKSNMTSVRTDPSLNE